MMYPRNAVFSLLIQLGDAPSVQGQNHGLLSVCSDCLWSHGNEWRGRSASSPPELQKLRGGFHHQSTKEKCKAFPSTLVGWAVLLLPTVALQPCFASCEAVLGWGIMHCSQLWFSMCRLARQSTRCRGWGFCSQLPSENQVLLHSQLQDRADSGDSSPETCIYRAVQRVSWPLKVPFALMPGVVEELWGYWSPEKVLTVTLFLF